MKKLYRSRRDKKLFGLCGGLAEMLNVDATLLRILLIVITVFSSGALILVYILAGLVVPKESNPFGGFGPGFGGYNPNGLSPVDTMAAIMALIRVLATEARIQTLQDKAEQLVELIGSSQHLLRQI